jgi:hypothetical protein
VSAIRAAGDGHQIFVATYDWSSVTNVARSHPGGPWIRDPGVTYEAHQYFDSDNTGRYISSYSAEVAKARAQHYRTPAR